MCGLKFEREDGYFLGAMYISYALGIGTIAALAALVWAAWKCADVDGASTLDIYGSGD